MWITDTLFYLWELPQNLVGLAVTTVMGRGKKEPYRNARVLRTKKMRGGISLGRYLIVNDIPSNPDLAQHEWGHTRQSRMLGPLYLPVIALPSLLWAAWWNPRRKRGYYTFYTERWADRLAGIKRPSVNGQGK